MSLFGELWSDVKHLGSKVEDAAVSAGNAAIPGLGTAAAALAHTVSDAVDGANASGAVDLAAGLAGSLAGGGGGGGGPLSTPQASDITPAESPKSGYSTYTPPASLNPPADPFDVAWNAPPLPMNWNSVAGAGKLTLPGLVFFKAGLSAALDDPTYKPAPLKSEEQLYRQWDLRPEGATPQWWRAITHDVWENSARYRADLVAANELYQKTKVTAGEHNASDWAADANAAAMVATKKRKTWMMVGYGVGGVLLLGLLFWLLRSKDKA